MKAPTLMQQNRVPVADVVVLDRLRPVSEAGVASLIASVEETGVMKDAIHVRKKKNGSIVLIAGAHRLEMARRLGWEEIEAKVWVDVTDDWSRIMEIDDNLAGAEMNALDTAVFLAERKRLYEKLHPETRADAFRGNQHTGKLAGDIVSFASSTADKFGLSKRHVERMIAAGATLKPDQITQLREAPQPVKLADLTELAKISDSDERAAVVLRLAVGNAKSAAKARKEIRAENGLEPPVKSAVDEEYLALMRAWARAGATARRRFASECYGDLAVLMASESMRGRAAK